MFAKLRASKASQVSDTKQLGGTEKSINIHEEYHRALRTKSYADCFNKAQLLANQPSFISNQNKFSQILLEPNQETIPSILDTSILSKTPKLKHLMLNYFEISAEASLICSHLLKSINQAQSNYHFIQRALDILDNHGELQNKFKLINFELNSFILSSNPFSNLNFKHISDKHSSMLNHLRSMRKKVGRKTKLMNYFKKTSRFFITLAFGAVAIAATVIIAHTLTAIIIGPAILSFNYEKKLPKLRLSKSNRFFCKVQDQLDIAAKGTYILNRDFDTMSRLVIRLHDEIEHNRAMVKFCLERSDDKFCLEIVKELKKSGDGFRKQVEELEEHVYLCLVTINRARGLVVKELTKNMY